MQPLPQFRSHQSLFASDNQLRVKQNIIIEIAHKIHENRLTNFQICESVFDSYLSHKQGHNWFNLVHQPINRSQIYAWVTIFACKNYGQLPTNLVQLQMFIMDNFSNLPAGYNITLGMSQFYFDEIINLTVLETESFGGQRYDLEVIRSSWYQFMPSRRVINDSFQKEYTREELKSILADIRLHKLDKYENYKLFESVFIHPYGILADARAPETLALRAAVSSLIINDQFPHSNFYSLLQHVFIHPVRLLVDPSDPTTSALRAGVYKLITKDILSAADFTTLFVQIFICPTGILADVTDPVTIALESALIKLIARHKLTHDSNYQLFKQVFIYPTGRLANSADPSIRLLQLTVVKLIQKNGLFARNNYKLYKLVFRNPTSILADPIHPLTKSLQQAVAELVINNQLLQTDIIKIFDDYLYERSTQPKALEQMMLDLLVKNKLDEPEVLKKLAQRVDCGAINIRATQQGIAFFVKVYVRANLSLFNLLTSNLDYFIQIDGFLSIQQIFNDNLLILPPDSNQLEREAIADLYINLQSIQPNLSVTLFKHQLINELSTSIFEANLDTKLKRQIRALPWSVKLGVNALTEILLALKQADAQLKKQTLQRIIKVELFGEQKLTESRQNTINAYIESLVKIDLGKICYDYITQRYFGLFSIAANHQQQAYQFIKPYINWRSLIEQLKQAKLAAIREKILLKDAVFNEKYPQLYPNYVINTLPYRSADDACRLVNNTHLTAETKQQLLLVVTYCKLNDLNSKDLSPLALVLAQDKTNHEPLLISFEDINYLNPSNSFGFNLTQLKLNRLDSQVYLSLNQLVQGEPQLIDYSQLDQVQKNKLLQKLKQIKNANILEQDSLALILDQKTNQLKSISKVDLANLLNNNVFTLNLQQVLSSDLSFQELDKVTFPEYLNKLILGKFTAANIISQALVTHLKALIKADNIQLNSHQFKNVESTIYQVALAPGKDIGLDLNFRKELMLQFKDNLGSESFEQKVFAKVVLHISQEYTLVTEQERLENLRKKLSTLPYIVVAHCNGLKFILNNDAIFTDLFKQLDQLPSLSTTIKYYQLAYLLGVIYLELSSYNAFGYHDYAHHDNRAFTLFRLMAGYWLASAVIIAGDALSLEQQTIINQEIYQTLLTDSCSGQIAYRLYNEDYKHELKSLYQQVKLILSAKAV